MAKRIGEVGEVKTFQSTRTKTRATIVGQIDPPHGIPGEPTYLVQYEGQKVEVPFTKSQFEQTFVPAPPKVSLPEVPPATGDTAKLEE